MTDKIGNKELSKVNDISKDTLKIPNQKTTQKIMEKTEDIKTVQPNIGIISKQDLYMTKLTDFFINSKNMNKMLDILHQKSCISLRVLDWFVTNYAKSNNVSYSVNGNSFNVHYDYRSQLKGYSKKYFDPFCRTGKDDSRLIDFAYDLDDANKTLSTTVGQLNFFKWAIENEVVDYVEKFFGGIEADMSASINARKKKNAKTEVVNTGDAKKRTPFNISATKTWTRTNTKFLISFD